VGFGFVDPVAARNLPESEARRTRASIGETMKDFLFSILNFIFMFKNKKSLFRGTRVFFPRFPKFVNSLSTLDFLVDRAIDPMLNTSGKFLSRFQ
jgi:hypothetical protein